MSTTSHRIDREQRTIEAMLLSLRRPGLPEFLIQGRRMR
jgi:hypothetical protein